MALDGTKVHANASRHSALSYDHAGKIKAQLQAEATDQADVPDGLSIPGELARQERRLAEIAHAEAVIEVRAKERHAREQAEYQAKIAARAATGKKPDGRVPQPPVDGTLSTACKRYQHQSTYRQYKVDAGEKSC